MSRMPAPVESPCNSVCRMDEQSGWCLGCYRTLDEIAAWSLMEDAARRAVRDQLQARRRSARQTRPEPLP